jgi:hypothetical protein
MILETSSTLHPLNTQLQRQQLNTTQQRSATTSQE